jgi:hypothetical protein
MSVSWSWRGRAQAETAMSSSQMSSSMSLQHRRFVAREVLPPHTPRSGPLLVLGGGLIG